MSGARGPKPITVETAAEALWVVRGEGAYDTAIVRCVAARKAKAEDHERFWQAVAKVIDLTHPRPSGGTPPGGGR